MSWMNVAGGGVADRSGEGRRRPDRRRIVAGTEVEGRCGVARIRGADREVRTVVVRVDTAVAHPDRRGRVAEARGRSGSFEAVGAGPVTDEVDDRGTGRAGDSTRDRRLCADQGNLPDDTRHREGPGDVGRREARRATGPRRFLHEVVLARPEGYRGEVGPLPERAGRRGVLN